MQDKIEHGDANVESINNQGGSMHSKLNLILKSISDVNFSTPFVENQEQLLDQLISLRIKHTMVEFEQCYVNLIEHHEDTIWKMIMVHDELLKATNELIKKTHIRH